MVAEGFMLSQVQGLIIETLISVEVGTGWFLACEFRNFKEFNVAFDELKAFGLIYDRDDEDKWRVGIRGRWFLYLLNKRDLEVRRQSRSGLL